MVKPLPDVVCVVRRPDSHRPERSPAVRTRRQKIAVRVKPPQNRSNNVVRRLPALVLRHALVGVHAVLVVAVPPCKRRVIAQSHRRVLSLLSQSFAEKLIVLRIIPAGHKEILYHNKPETVAYVIEHVPLEYPAAPYPDGVHPGLGSKGQNVGYLPVTLSRWERLARDIICPLTHDLHTVYHDREAGKSVVPVPERIFAAYVRGFL